MVELVTGHGGSLDESRSFSRPKIVTMTSRRRRLHLHRSVHGRKPTQVIKLAHLPSSSLLPFAPRLCSLKRAGNRTTRVMQVTQFGS